MVESGLPRDLTEFYSRNEGIGLESNPDRIVRLCMHEEVVRMTWPDIPIFGAEDCPGWEDFEGFLIGVSAYHDYIYLVQQAPCCSAGAILTLGPGVAGPGGQGPYKLEPSLVLAANFHEWLAHLERYDWFEYGLAPGEIWDKLVADQAALCAYYKALNPDITWGNGMPELPE